MTPLLFLDGLGGGHSAWDAPVSHFSRLGYPCRAWDQPGYGETPLVEPGCGHLGQMDQPQAFNAVLESFLRKYEI